MKENESNNSDIVKKDKQEVATKPQSTSTGILDLDAYLEIEKLVDKLENSTIASQFKETVFDKDEEGDPIESTKRVIFNKADMVMCLALGRELGIAPMTALSYGKQLNTKAIAKIERGKRMGLDFTTSLDQIYIWSSGGRDLTYVSIHIVNAVLNKIGVTQEIVNNGHTPVVKYRNLETNELMDATPDNGKVIPNHLPADIHRQLITKMKESNLVAFTPNYIYTAEVKLTRYNKVLGRLDSISIPYTNQQAIDAGLLKGIKSDGTKVDGKDNWNNHPVTHLIKMSVMLGARIIAADALGGIYVDSELAVVKDIKSNNNNIEDAEIVG